MQKRKKPLTWQVWTGRRRSPLPISVAAPGVTLLLARLLNAQVTAVDLFPDFLDVLEARAEHLGLSYKIKILCGSMDNLPFEEAEYDVIWSEGAIYNIGFEKGGHRLASVS
ncbi:MAG: class I SAM-dependent methyltransferase [Desulfobacterales bacterium]